jgi:hypothetical protein
MSEFVQGILLGVALALGAGAIALYMGRVNSGSGGRADEHSGTAPEQPARPQPPQDRRR